VSPKIPRNPPKSHEIPEIHGPFALNSRGGRAA
jgi:hypothetical protein